MKKKLLSTLLILIFTGCSDNSVTSSEDNLEVDLNKVYKWNMVTTWPKNYPGLGLAAENLSKYVDEMSNGRMKIKSMVRANWFQQWVFLMQFHKAMLSWAMVLLITGQVRLSPLSFTLLFLLV